MRLQTASNGPLGVPRALTIDRCLPFPRLVRRDRRSIAEPGLDWTRMGVALGIAGSERPEVEGCFMCLDESEVEWFQNTINDTGGSVDIWEVDGLTFADLIESSTGHDWYPGTIPPERVRLLRAGA